MRQYGCSPSCLGAQDQTWPSWLAVAEVSLGRSWDRTGQVVGWAEETDQMDQMDQTRHTKRGPSQTLLYASADWSSTEYTRQYCNKIAVSVSVFSRTPSLLARCRGRSSCAFALTLAFFFLSFFSCIILSQHQSLHPIIGQSRHWSFGASAHSRPSLLLRLNLIDCASLFRWSLVRVSSRSRT